MQTMSNENTPNIHAFDFNLICDYFSHTERQGPGSPEATLKALSFIDNLTDSSLIADLGCGTGGQSMVLAQHTPGHLTGLDLFPGFIDRFNAQALKFNLQDRVRGIVGSMHHLPFGKESLDLIWSEGAIYHMGFERGLKEWRKFLKTGGYIAVTEASWFTGERPAEIHDFWMNAYPEIDTIPNQIDRVQKTGYVPVAHFILPTTCWTEHFYAPLKTAREIFLQQHAGEKAAEAFIASELYEESLYHKYKAFYGYTFFIAKKGKP